MATAKYDEQIQSLNLRQGYPKVINLSLVILILLLKVTEVYCDTIVK